MDLIHRFTYPDLCRICGLEDVPAPGALAKMIRPGAVHVPARFEAHIVDGGGAVSFDAKGLTIRVGPGGRVRVQIIGTDGAGQRAPIDFGLINRQEESHGDTS